GPCAADRCEVTAAPTAPAAGLRKTSDLAKPPQLVTKIPVRPPPDPDAPEPDEEQQKKDTRPSPGDNVTFVEQLTDAQLVPRSVTPAVKPPKAPKAPTNAPAATAPSGPPPPPGPPVLTRSYVIRGVARNGNAGTPTLPLHV